MKKLEEYVRCIPDFPEEGVMFRDVTSVLQDADGLHLAIDTMQELIDDLEFDVVVGPESRGFIFGTPIAYNNHKPFVLIRKKGKLPILCGGTGMYIEAVLKGYRLLDVPQNPELRESLKDKSLPELEQILAGYKVLHNKTDVDTAQRAIRAIEIEEYYKNEAPDANEYDPIESLIIGIDIDRELRRGKISRRLHARLDEGMVEEVRKIIDSGVKPEDLIYYGLEYKYLTLYIIGELSYEDMVSQLEIAIHQFAKRQMTWFRGMERRGSTIHWIDATLPTEEKIEKALELLKR